MYENYLREREGKDILKHDHGFTIYGHNCVPGADFPHVYISDNWVEPSFRKSGIAREMADQICKDAKNRGFGILLGSVDVNAKSSHESLLVLIAYGMRLYTISGNTIFMSKEL